MALKSPFAIKSVIGTTDLTLTASAGESLLVKEIICEPTSDVALTIRTAKTTVGFFRLRGDTGDHLYAPHAVAVDGMKASHMNLLSLLLMKGIFSGYPIAEGETMVFSGGSEATGVQMVVYEIWDAGDKKATDPNGSASKEFYFQNYGRFSTTLADGENLYATRQCPVEFPDFPWGVTAPQGKIVTLHGICFAPVAVSSDGGADKQETEYVKLLSERVVLFDEDRNGILAYHPPGAGNTTNRQNGRGPFGLNTERDSRPPFFFPKPLEFRGGEELGVYVTTNVSAGSANISADKAELSFIETVRPE